MIPIYLDINIIQRNYIKYRPISLMNICAKILIKLNPITHKKIYTMTKWHLVWVWNSGFILKTQSM